MLRLGKKMPRTMHFPITPQGQKGSMKLKKLTVRASWHH
jgi:hypothetical protein